MPEPRAEVKAQPSFVPAKPEVEESVTSETKQLELRAIFGVDHELSQLEIMQRARGLPGILNVSKANAKEVEALELLKGCASKLGLEENDPVVMSSPQGFIDFVLAACFFVGADACVHQLFSAFILAKAVEKCL